MNSNDWPPLRLEPEKVTLMRNVKSKAGTSTIVLAALLATGCVHAPKLAHGQQVFPGQIKFDCEGKVDKNLRDAINKSLPASGDYCAARAELDDNKKTVEALILSPSGGSAGDILEVFQFGDKGVRKLTKDNSILVFMDGIAIDTKSTNGLKNLLSYPPARPKPFIISYGQNGYTIAFK